MLSESKSVRLDRSAPTLTLFCGLPGAGKSTLARRLEAAGRGVRLSTDEWQATLVFEHTETEFHGRLQLSGLLLLELESFAPRNVQD